MKDFIFDMIALLFSEISKMFVLINSFFSIV